MAEPVFNEIRDPQAWDAALLQLPCPHILQSWAWGETKAQTGWRAVHWLWTREGRPAAAAAMLVRRLGGLPETTWSPYGLPGLIPAVAYVPRGPILDWTDLSLAGSVLAALESHARRAGAIFVKIDPDVHGDATAQAAREALTGRGWRPSAEQVQFRNTVVSDLSLPEDALLAGMRPKWRYNIRLAERRGVSVRAGTGADLPAFYIMYLETGSRDGFLVRPYAYYQAIWEPFLARGLAHLLLAEVAGAPVAGLILFRFGPTAWYFYGASTARSRALMPNHALQWAAMRWAREAGCARYDWWGAPDALAESDPMWGVYRFKEGFGGEFVPGIGAYDYPARGLLHWCYSVAMPRLLEAARRRHRAGLPAPDPAPDEAVEELQETG